MKTKNFIPLVLICLCTLFISCENPTFALLTRSTNDPFFDVPAVNSFRTEKRIYVSWQQDEGTDIYVLMRAVDDSYKIYKQVYRGENCFYTDTDIEVSQRYLYRLDKIRGKKYFKGNKNGYGVYSNLINDEYEDNNVIERATYLEYACLANIYCYRFTDGNYLEDEDWYTVRIPPRRQAQIVINEADLSTGQPVSFYVSNPMVQSDIKPNQNISFDIKNTSEKTKSIAFKVYPDRSKFSGGMIKSYEIRLERIVNL